jgi:hypothetical protein
LRSIKIPQTKSTITPAVLATSPHINLYKNKFHSAGLDVFEHQILHCFGELAMILWKEGSGSESQP